MAARKTSVAIDTELLDRARELLGTSTVRETIHLALLEVLFSARSYQDYVRTKRRRELAYRQVPLTQQTFRRAIEVQQELAGSGHHRLLISDLIISAAAEGASLTVLHYDGDFDTIARVTGQATEWVVARGSVP